MPRGDAVEWIELAGDDLVGVPVDSAIETLRGVGFKVSVAGFPRPRDFPSPVGDRVYLHVDDTKMVKGIEAQ